MSVIWLTGECSVGKTTIANLLYTELKLLDRTAVLLDGDTVREFFPGTGFDREAINAHIEKMGRMAALLEKQGFDVICSFVSPFRESREVVRSMAKHFVEVRLKADHQVRVKRDTHGIYHKRANQQVTNVAGIDYHYEENDPELILRTDVLSKELCVHTIMEKIK